MKSLELETAFATVWHGEISGLVPTASDASLRARAREALQRFATALDKKVLYPAEGGTLTLSDTDEGVEWRLGVEHLPGQDWKILGNLLAFAAVPGAWPGRLRVAGAEARFSMDIAPRLYDAPIPHAPFAVNLDKATGYLDDFVLRIEFKSALPADEREAFCQALDAWAGIVDHNGAFPMEESPRLASVIGPHVCRFEDPATAIVEGEGIAAAPSAFAPILGLCIYWSRKFAVSEVSLEAPS